MCFPFHRNKGRFGLVVTEIRPPWWYDVQRSVVATVGGREEEELRWSIYLDTAIIIVRVCHVNHLSFGLAFVALRPTPFATCQHQDLLAICKSASYLKMECCGASELACDPCMIHTLFSGGKVAMLLARSSSPLTGKNLPPHSSSAKFHVVGIEQCATYSSDFSRCHGTASFSGRGWCDDCR